MSIGSGGYYTPPSSVALTEDVVSQLRARFSLFDTNRNGLMDRRELKTLLSSLYYSYSDEYIDTLFVLCFRARGYSQLQDQLTFEEFQLFMTVFLALHDAVVYYIQGNKGFIF